MTTYTWSKSLDDASDTGTTNNEYNLPQNSYAPELESAPSSFDHRNRFTATAIYDLPFATHSSGWKREAFAGWKVSGLMIAQSGAPFTVNLSTAAGNEPANVGLVNASVNVERPNDRETPTMVRVHRRNVQRLPAFFAGAFTLGDSSRNMVLGPRFIGLDLSLQKDFALSRGRPCSSGLIRSTR